MKIGLFTKRSVEKKPRAVAFVDYEHWYISLDKMYHVKPDIRAWVEDMSQTLNVQEIYFFADFSKAGLREEIPKIRGFTNKIIETGSMTTRVQKDFTDFIMLDHIYQEAMSRQNDNDVFVIFTGDGHFYSVVSFLKNICKKTVGIYAVRSALSTQLKLTASWFKEVPDDRAKLKPYFRMIFNFLSEEEANTRKQTPTFLYAVGEVAKQYEVEIEDVREAMQFLVDSGYIRREEEQRGGRTASVINAEWNAVLRDGLWLPKQGARLPQTKQKQPKSQTPKASEKRKETASKQDPPAKQSPSGPATNQANRSASQSAKKEKPTSVAPAKKQNQPAKPKQVKPADPAREEEDTPVRAPRVIRSVPIEQKSEPSKTVEQTAAGTQPAKKRCPRRRKQNHPQPNKKETT